MTKLATRLSTAPAATTLPAEDLKRARSFYEEKLGLETEARDDMPEGFFVHAGKGSLIFLYERGRATAENTAVTFEVDDLEGTVSELRSRGVRFEDYDIPERPEDHRRHRVARRRQGRLVQGQRGQHPLRPRDTTSRGLRDAPG